MKSSQIDVGTWTGRRVCSPRSDLSLWLSKLCNFRRTISTSFRRINHYRLYTHPDPPFESLCCWTYDQCAFTIQRCHHCDRSSCVILSLITNTFCRALVWPQQACRDRRLYPVWRWRLHWFHVVSLNVAGACWCKKMAEDDSVDGWNPAPLGMDKLPTSTAAGWNHRQQLQIPM